MIQAEDYVYSKSAVARMLNVAQSLVTKVEKWPINSFDKCSIVFVIVKGRRPRFWKKFDFLCHFADWRRAQSKELVVDRLMPDTLAVINEKKKSKYVVKIKPDAIACTCEDYKNQNKFLPKAGVCKHGYAVLNSLGIAKFSEYVKNNGYEKALDNFKKEKAHKLKIARTDAYNFAVQDRTNIYYCDLHPSIIKCSCTQYDPKRPNSEQFCTHGYAILNYLGFTDNQQIKDYKLGYEWIVDDYINNEDEINAINQAMNDEGEELDRLKAEREAIESAKSAEEQDAMNCLFTAQSWSIASKAKKLEPTDEYEDYINEEEEEMIAYYDDKQSRKFY